MKNNCYVIDVHAHVFPDKIAGKASANIGNFYKLKATYQGRVSELLTAGQQSGIDEFVICSPATTVAQVHNINAFLASCAAAYPMCRAFGTLHPFSDTLEQDFEFFNKMHLLGVKLHPDFQNFAIDDPAAYPMYDMLQSTGLPVLMHMGDNRQDLSHQYRLKMVLRTFPRLRVIAAHFGGWRCWDEAFDLLEASDRLRFDTSSSLPFLSNEMLRKFIRHYGAENIFFGADYPLWDYDQELGRFFDLGLREEENRRILGENLLEWMNWTKLRGGENR